MRKMKNVIKHSGRISRLIKVRVMGREGVAESESLLVINHIDAVSAKVGSVA